MSLVASIGCDCDAYTDAKDTKLKLYSYIGIGKYLGEWGVSNYFPLGASGGRKAL